MMFDQTFVDGRQKSNKPLTLLASTLIQLSILAVLLLAPLVYTATLPGPVFKGLLVAPRPPRALVTASKTKQTPGPLIRVLRAESIFAPISVPKQVSPMNDVGAPPDVPTGVASGPDGVPGSSSGGITDSLPTPAPLPEQPKPRPATRAVRMGTGAAEARLINKVMPAYPSLAKTARVQGVVEFSATISKDGNIENLQVISGHPLLINAARDAVLQWKYRPTLLNGQPVEVLTQIVVNFTLTQ